MAKKFDIITIGGATQDIMYYTDDAEIIKNKKNILKQELLAFEYGAKIASNDVHITFGGGGMNTAVSFSVLGFKVSTFLNLGIDWIGQVIIKELKNKKIDTSYITQSKELYSGFSFIINYGDYNEHVIFTHRGANRRLNLAKSKLSKINSKWLYIASLSGKSLLVEQNIKNIFDIIPKKNIKIAWNPGSAQLAYGYNFFKKYLPNVEFFNINKDEAIELSLSAKIKTNNINKLLKTIHSWGPKIIAITHGHSGAYIYNGKKIYFMKALLKKGINTTGAGDAFSSSFVAGLIRYNNDFKKSLKLAIYRSNYVIRKIGAQVGLLNKNQLKKFKL